MASRNINFDKRLPRHYQLMGNRHWSGEDAIYAAAAFLSEHESSVLDIGSGVGKFCILAAAEYPACSFTGVEKRSDLVELSNKQKKTFNVTNCTFTNSDVRDVDFSQFNSFYFFNSFLELIDKTCVMDENSQISIQEYIELNTFLFSKLKEAKTGTRIAIYHGSDAVIPPSYKFIEARFSNLLKFYSKERESTAEEKIDIEKLERYIQVKMLK